MSLEQVDWQCVSTEPCALGESPFWQPHEQKLYWVDIVGKTILRASIDTGHVESWAMPSEPGCIAPAARGGLVIALRHGVFRADAWQAPLALIATLDYDPGRQRANDGKCDALGRFWVGTLDETRLARDAKLFALDWRQPGAPRIKRQLDPSSLPATTANGLAWSPDGRTAYWADTSAHVVHAWDFDAQANRLSAPRCFKQFPPKPPGWQFAAAASATDLARAYAGRPDGAAVDVQGNYYVAMYEGARLCKLAPDGRLLAQFATPALCPTMPCFGGKDLRTLFITTARHHCSAAALQAFPLSGCVFSTPVEVPGLPVNFFVD